MTPAYQDALTELYLGDAAEVLCSMPAESVHCVITSPPYWGGIRSYRGLGAEQLGHEATPDEYVDRIVGIMREVRRVLRGDGTLWLNLGDNRDDGEENDIPLMVKFALAADGWRRKDTVIWHKLAPMPESVSGTFWGKHRVKTKKGEVARWGDIGESAMPRQDHPGAEWADCPGCPTCAQNDGLVLRRGQGRTTKSHEYLFLLAKGDKYYFDNEAIKERGSPDSHTQNTFSEWTPEGQHMGQVVQNGRKTIDGYRNRRSVWSLPPEPQGDALCAGCRTYYETRPRGKCPKCGGVDHISHYAAFVQGLVEPCILAGTSARGCCPRCGAPWARVVETKPMVIKRTDWGERAGNRTASSGTMIEQNETTTLTWRATCRCDAGEPIPCTVLDCFSGSGTTSIVARRLGRRSIGIELAPDYVELSSHRLRSEQPGMALGV